MAPAAMAQAHKHCTIHPLTFALIFCPPNFDSADSMSYLDVFVYL